MGSWGPPRRRGGLRTFGDWHTAISSVGTRTSRRLGAWMDRRPLGLPLAALAVGIVLLVVAFALSPGTGHAHGEEPTSAFDLLIAVSLLFVIGGVLVLAGVAGLVSAAVVHIVKRRGG